jgi:hypothetical protein
MKIPIFLLSETAVRYPALVLAAVLAGAGAATAETYRHGNSTATIEQHGGSTDSEAQVRRYRDGQSIITRDGNSTDITIQREGSGSATDDAAQFRDEYFHGRFPDERFSRFGADDQDDADTGDDFEQRMHERRHRDFSQ